MVVFGNVGFMGIPIITSIYPEKGMLYISVFTVIDQLMLWTLGVKLTSPAEKESGKFNPRKLINPVTVAIILAHALCADRDPSAIDPGYCTAENGSYRNTPCHDLSGRNFCLH